MNKSITVQGSKVTIISKENEDYICLTDMVKSQKGGDQLIKNWLQTKNTIEFLGVWEELNNPDFNLVEFHQIRSEAGSNAFLMSVKQWIAKTGAGGIIAKAGRYGGTYAHKDIALEFASWLSPALRLFIIKEFQRLKEEEAQQFGPEWSINRTLAKVNYRIHTDAVKRRLIPPTLSKKDVGFVYASEADVINKAVFGKTAKEWRTAYPGESGNIRDHASVEQLLVLANIESYNSILIEQGIQQSERLVTLNAEARRQFTSITQAPAVKSLKPPPLLKGRSSS